MMSAFRHGGPLRRRPDRDCHAEALEFRRLLAEVVVTNTANADNGDTSSIAALIANPGPDGISLREAIAAANNTPGADVIGFNLLGGGVAVIATDRGFVITDTVTIDGFTQPGSTANTLPLGNNAVQNVEIRGQNVIQAFSSGFVIQPGAEGTIIQGLSITGWTGGLSGNGIGIQVLADDVTIRGNRVGIDPFGAVAGNDTGVRVGGAANVVIGGNSAADRNVISGNGAEQIELFGAGGRVVGNFVGSNVSGDGEVKVGSFGIRERGYNNHIGGAGVFNRNIVVGQITGIDTSGAGGFIGGSFVGLGANGEPLGNGGDGIRIRNPLTADNIIRVGSEDDSFNAPVIAYNAGHGINVAQGDAAIGQVSIHNNGGQGIHFGSAGFGSLMLTSATTTATGTVITGTISGVQPGDGFVVTFYGNTDNGQQEAAIGGGFFLADANGVVNIDAVIPACGLPKISAIADRDELAPFGTSQSLVSLAIANNRPPVIEITNAAGSGPGSIVAAFTAAANTPGPEVILLNIPGTGFIDITPTQPLIPMFGLNNNVLFEGRGQGFGSVVPRTFINVNNGLGTFNAGADNTVAGVGFFNVAGRAFDAVNGNNTLIHSTVGLSPAEQPFGVGSIVQSDVVRILGGSNNRILGNAIHAGRSNANVAIFGGNGHVVQGNRIGVTQSGVVLGGTAATNNRVGVVINDGTGTDVTDNTIAGMTQDAIKTGEFGFPGGSGHSFIGNSMFLNAGLGIDHEDDGVTPNDGPGDLDGVQNYPVLVAAEQVAGGVRVNGTFESGLNMLYSLEAFATSSAPLNVDEGARPLGTLSLATDGDGSVPFDLTFPGGAVFGERILVTATAPDGRTSEFSISVPLTDDFSPEILNGTYEFEYENVITFDVAERGITGVDPTDLTVESIPPGGALEVVAAFLLEDQQAIRYILGATGRGPVPDGNYRATLQPNTFQDAAGNLGPPVSRDGGGRGGNAHVVDFFVFAGDANRDRAINIADFSILAGNFNEEGFYSDGDFDHSGRVDIADFAILAGKFNTTLPEPAVGRTPVPWSTGLVPAALPAARDGAVGGDRRGAFAELIEEMPA